MSDIDEERKKGDGTNHRENPSQWNDDPLGPRRRGVSDEEEEESLDGEAETGRKEASTRSDRELERRSERGKAAHFQKAAAVTPNSFATP